MATFGELITNVSKRIIDPNNTAVSQEDVASALNNAIKYWKKKRFWFNEATATVTMTEDDSTLPLPSDFYMPAYNDGAFVIVYSNQRYPLKKTTQPTYDSFYMDNGNGLPRCYGYVGESYEVYPIPDRAYTVIVRYLKEYDEIAASNYNATNDFIEHADRLITLWACADLNAELRQDPKMESYFRNGAVDEEKNLLNMTRKLNASGRLTVY